MLKQLFRPSHRGIPALLLASIIMLAAACAPPAAVQQRVTPMVISVKPADGQLHIQGRYFGSGAGGHEAGNYLVAGATAQGEGGFILSPTSWTSTHISAPLPTGVNPGFVFVFVDGHRSTGLPVNQR